MRAALAITLCLSGLLLTAASAPARADFRVCNASGGQIRLAFGNHDNRFGWTSRGWWALAAGACQMVLYGEVPRGIYYVYTIDGADRGIGVPEAQAGGSFCIKDQNFDLRSSGFMTPQNTIVCEGHGVKAAKFLAVEVAEAVLDHTHTLSPGAPSVGALLPQIKQAAQNLERPAAPATPAAAPAALSRPAAPAGTACQRYPNLC